MAEATVFVKVVTLDPVRGALIPIPGVQVRVQNDGFWSNPDLSVGTPVTASDEENKGIAEVPLRFEESEQNNLDPFITITLPAEHRTVPAEAPEAQRFQLPEEWCDRRRRSLPQLLAHTSRENPAEVIVGFPAQLELAYVDFHRSGLRNPLALPEDTLQVHLADVDVCFDDTMTGFGMAADPESRDRRVVAVGEDEDEYPYLDVWPTAPEAMGDLPERPDAFLDSPRGWIEPPRSWLDPPGAPVGMLGGAGFEQTGPLTVDGRGFVFMLDGRRIRRFYPDGTLCETVEVRGALPVGLAADPAGNLFVAAGLRGVIMFRRDDDGYLHRVDRVLSTWTILPDDPLSAAPVVSFSVRNAQGVAVSDGLLLVADADGRSVWVFSIAGFSDEAFGHQGTMQRSTTGTELFQRPVAVAMDRQGRLYVGDDQGHKVLCLTLVWDAGGNLLGEQIWVHAGGAEFSPEAIAVDGKNQIVYALEAGGRPILRLDAGSGDPLPSWTPMPAPNAVAVDPRGEVYVAGGEEPQVRRFTFFQADGTVLADRAEPRPAGDPWLPAPAEQHMSRPGYVVFDSEGRLWVSDTGNDRVLMFQRNAAGELERSRILSEGLDRPAGVVRGPEGELFVAEAHRVRRYDASLSASEVFDATFQDSAGLAIGRRDGELRLYVADKGRNQVAVLGLDGSSFDPITTDGTTAFSEPEDVAVDSRHNLYVADTGNQRLVCFPAASGGTPRAIVVSAHGLSFSQPCGVSVDDEDRLLVTDRERNTVFRLTTDGTLLEFWDLECLVQHSLSWAYQAPIDGTVRFSAGLEVEPTIPHLGQEAWRVTAAGELRIEGSGGRIKREPVPVGSVLLVREGQSVEGSERLAAIARKKIYHPDLARLVRFDAPVRAVVDSRGLMAVADGGNDRIRLVRVRTNLDVNLIELGGSEPDISRRMRTRADWESDLGLKLAVGDNVDCFGESYESFTNPETEGTEDFIRERFCRRDVLRSQPNGKVNAAVNVLKVVRQAQRWHRHLTAAASEEQDRWGRTALTFFADLSDSVTWSSSYSLRDFIGLARDLSGRGSDAWDDSVVVHEMAHWIFSHLLPRPAYLAHAARYGRTLRESAGDHWANEITSQDLALNDGFSEFAELFWGDITDRVRGYPSSVLRTVWRGLAHDRDRLDLFEVPGRGLENEGYFTNTVWQIFHALVDPGILFADCPAHWYPRNLCLTETQSRRYVDLLRKPLRSFAAEGLPEHPVAQYLTEILVQAHAGYSEFVRIIQSIFELNNQLMPEIAVSEGPDNPDVGEEVEVPRTERKSLIVRVKDASGEALAGYNLRFHVGPGDPGHFSASGGAEVRHGRRSLSPEETAARDWLQATDGEGAVELEFTAPADAGAEELQISYQPVFATDETFTQSPQDDDDWETTLRKLYLRALGRVGPPAHQGAEVTRTMTFRIL